MALLALIGFMTLLPILPRVAGSAHNLARVAQMPVLLLAAVCLAARAPGGRTLLRPWGLFWAASGALALASCCAAAAPAFALRELVLLAGLVGLAYFVALASGESHRMLMMAVAAGWAIYATQFLLLLSVVLPTEAAPNGWLLVGGFDNPRFLNHAQTVAIPLLVGIGMSGGLSERWRRLSWFALIASFVLLALTFGRATMVALLASGLLALLLFGAAGASYAKRLAVAAAAGGFLYGLVFKLLPAVLETSFLGPVRQTMDMTSDHSRMLLWRRAVGFVAEAPWLGIGPMHFAHHPNPTGAHPHNIYLQLAAEYGLPLLLLIASGAALALTAAARRIRGRQAQGDAAWLVAAFVACVGALVDGALSGNFVMPVSQVWIAVAAGVLGGGVARPPAAQPPSPAAGGAVMPWLAWALVGTLLWLSAATLVEYRQATPRLGGAVGLDAGSGKWMPRYWLDGWF